jgi:nitric oxide reductase NorQ protein
VVIHPLTDNRRTLFIDKRREVISAAPGFQLVISYNPGYQSLLKDLKQSTRQRFVALDFDYPAADQETEIVVRESGVDGVTARALVDLGEKIRNIREHGLTEGASTRLLIYAGQMMTQGVAPVDACRAAVCLPLSDDERLQETLAELVADLF